MTVPASAGWRSAMLGCMAALGIACHAPVFGETTCRPFIEEDRSGTYATFRAHGDAFADCPVAEETYRSVVAAWLRGRAANAAHVRTLSLGRAVAFPWLSQLIADTALARADWAAQVAAASGASREQLAASVLRDPKLRDRLALPFDDSRYTVVRVSFEKVSFARADELRANETAGNTLVPFDAQIWLRLERR